MVGSHTITKYVDSADGTRLYADAVGDPCKPALVFVAGLGLTTIVFDELFTNANLLSDFYLVRYDPRGNGRSDHPLAERHTSKGHAEDFAAVSKSLKLVTPIYVGWSIGAAEVTDICQHLPPDAIVAAVFLAGWPFLDPSFQVKTGSKRLFEIAGNTFQSSNLDVLRDSMLEISDMLFADAERIPYLTRMAWFGCTFLQAPETRVSIISRESQSSGLYAAGQRGLPLLVINSDLDRYRNRPEGVYEELKPHFRDIEYKLIKGAGHAMFIEKQEETVDAIKSFANRVLKQGEAVFD